jgi:hypothetical protein
VIIDMQSARPGDIFVDEQGQEWTVLGTHANPTVVLQRVELPSVLAHTRLSVDPTSRWAQEWRRK